MNKMYVFATFLFFSLSISAQTNNPSAVNIYSAGTYKDGETDIGCYWINGDRHNLDLTDLVYTSKGGYRISPSISAITVADNSVYVLGRGSRSSEPNTFYMFYWKDGVRYTVTSNSRVLNPKSITVSNGSVYILGTIQQDTTVSSPAVGAGYIQMNRVNYWKDGVLQNLDHQGIGRNLSSYGSSIKVYNNSVYIAGSYNTKGGGRDMEYSPVACYWKDGVRQNLDQQGGTSSEAYDIVISGNSVYVAGVIYKDNKARACYWKDGIQQTLDNENLPAKADDGALAVVIAIDGTSVYTAGNYWYRDESKNYRQNVYYWNGNARQSVELSNMAYHAITDLKVLNKKVYLAGYFANKWTEPHHCYWIDGKLYDLGIMSEGNRPSLFIQAK